MNAPVTTEQSSRQTGVDLIGSVPWGTHICQLYRNADDLIQTHIAYFMAGLSNNEACLWILPDFLPSDAAETALHNAIHGFRDCLHRRQIDLVPSTDWYLQDGRFAVDRLQESFATRLAWALSQGYDGLRIAGEGGWYKSVGWENVLEYEKLAGKGILGQPLLALCAYQLDECSASQITEMVSLHKYGLITRGGSVKLMEVADGQAREALKKELDFASALLDLAPCQMVVLDKSGRIVRANQACADVFGQRPDELEEAFIWDLSVHRHKAEAVKAFCEQGISSDFRMKFEHDLVCPDGKRRLITWAASTAVDPNNGDEYIIAVGSDITERVRIEEELRESRERLELAQEAGGIGTWEWDYRDGSAKYSESYYAIYGLSPDHPPLSAEEWLHFVHPDDQEHVKKAIDLAVQGVGSAEAEFRIVRPDGETRWIASRARLLRDASGKVTRVVGVNVDITERRLMEDELRRGYHREKAIAGTLQGAMLPSINVSVEGFGIAGLYKPALNEAEVGGDFYDLFALPDGRLAFVIGDVSGKGLQAAVYTAMAKYMLRAYADGKPDPALVVRRLNRAMYDYTTDEVFTALVYGILDPAARTIIYANAGHDRPLLYDSARGEAVPLEVTGQIIGIRRDCTYEVGSLQMRPGDFLLLYTDGITDARNAQGFFDIEGLSQVVSANAHQGAELIAQAAYEAALSHADGDLGDDAAILILRASPEESEVEGR